MDVVTLTGEGYSSAAKDEHWIPRVAARGLVILTKDKKIRRDSIELHAVLTSRAFYFTLGGGNYTGAEMAETILYHRPTIERLVASRQPPVIAQLNRNEVLLRDRDGELRLVKRRP